LIYIIHIPIIIFLIVFFKKKFNLPTLEKYYYWAVAYKLTIGLALYALYVYYYKNNNLDTFYFLHACKTITYLFQHDFNDFINLLFFGEISSDYNFAFLFIDDTRSSFFIRLIWIFSYLSYANPWLICAYLSLFCFFASWYLVVSLSKLSEKYTYIALFAFCVFPSTTLWSSGISKETVTIGCIYILISFVIRLVKLKYKISFLQYLVSISCFWFLWKIKFYYGAVLSISIICYCILYYTQKLSVIKKIILSFSVLLCLFVLMRLVFPTFDTTLLLHVLYESYSRNIENSTAQSVVTYPFLPDWQSFLLNSPKALFSGLFRPFFWESKNILHLIASLENIIVLLLFIGALYFTIATKRHKAIKTHHWLPIILYCGVLAILIPLAAPNFGTLIRYKSAYLPIIIFACSALIEWKIMTRKF